MIGEQKYGVAQANVPRLVPGQSDTERAAEYKRRALELLSQLCVIMNEARDNSLVVSFQISNDQFGRFFPQQITVVRPL